MSDAESTVLLNGWRSQLQHDFGNSEANHPRIQQTCQWFLLLNVVVGIEYTVVGYDQS